MDQKKEVNEVGAEFVPPIFSYSKKTVLLPIVAAVAAFFVSFIFVLPLLGMEAIQNEDEAGAITAFFVSLGIAAVAAVIVAIVVRKIVKKTELANYRREYSRLKKEYDENQKKAETDRKNAEAAAKERAVYEICEFCGGELEYHHIKGYTHNSSYQDGYKLEVKTSNTGILRENRVNYHISTGTESYRCPHCHYYMSIKYEAFNGILKSYVGKDIYGKDEEMLVPREKIKQGRLFSSFKIVGSQIRY